MAETTKVTRSWGATIGFLVGGFVSLGLSVLLFISIAEGPVTFGIALIPAVLGLILFYMSVGGAGSATCPSCGASLSGLSTGANDGVLCDSCHKYCEGKDGSLWQTDQNRIADDSIFSSPLPESFNFPAVCCVCGGPATSSESVSLRMQNASAPLTAATVGVTSSTTVTVEVPHCSVHKGGASLAGTPKAPHIRFRSYPYLRAFCQVNGTSPG